jgi:RHS repeat-associated protein
MNRLTAKTADAFFAQNSIGAAQISFTYSPTGLRLSMTDASGVTSYAYDNHDRLLTKATPQGTLTYAYDPAGNILSLNSSNPGGASMVYTYDPLNRLDSVTDASGKTTYSYDAVGNLSSFAYPNGVSTSYAYNSLNRLTSMQSICSAGTGCRSPGAAIKSYAYTLSAAGNRLSVAELGDRAVQYGYDDLYRLTSETISGASTQNGTISYQYDSVGNRLKINSTVPAIAATGLLNYDANDRDTANVFDNNGNTINNGGQNVYDFENRLVQRGNISLVYDGDGNRVSETVAGVTTSYLVADQNLTGYAQVLDELQAGTVTRTYSYGLGLINERQVISGNLTTSFYGYDGHGSVRFLTDSTAAITDTYDYDAFGNLIASTGITPNNYLFAGEQFDPALGIYYNRARYYDQRLGRFWTADTYEGKIEDPISLHKYLYAHADPVVRKDPSGHFDVMEELGALQVQASLFVQNTALRVGAVFAAGGGVLGRFFNQLGAYAEKVAMEVVELVAIDNPEAIVKIEEDVEAFEEGGGRRLLDIGIRTASGLKDILIEVKYKLPTDGAALTRLLGQINAGLQTGSEVIVWTLKSPTASELTTLSEELGPQAGNISVLSGVENLFRYLSSLLQ